MSPGPMLAPMPASCCAQTFFNMEAPQGSQQHHGQDAASVFQFATELFQKACDRLNCASDNLGKASDCMMEVTKVMLAREAAAQERVVQMNKNDLVLRLGRNHGAERHGDDPAGSHTQKLYDRARRTVKEFAVWFQKNTTLDELKGPWIQFSDSPRITVDGVYLKRLLKRAVDVEAPMGFAVARLLKRGEGKKEPDCNGKCHYLLHDWAAKALQDNSSPEECLALFDRQKRKYKLSECSKIVPFVLLGDKWVSLSIDLVRRSTLLIHPTASARPTQEVEDEFRPMCQHLTYVALSNMTALTGKQINPENWAFGLALQQEHQIMPNNAGAVTFYYSIPKENQFMIVSDATIDNAKQSFVHELVKMCHPLTKKRVQKGFRPVNDTKKRKMDGKFSKRKGKDVMTEGSSEGSEEGSCTPSAAAAVS